MARWKKRIKKWKHSIRKRLFKLVPDVVHIGRRAFTRGILLSGQPGIEKHFALNAEGRVSFEREVLAQQLFKDRPWMVPTVQRGARTLAMPRFKEDQRLDRAAREMTADTKVEAARQALRIAWEIFNQGYAHRDFHSHNLFWVNGRLMATDFETMEPYPEGRVPAFPECYDITGKGLESPHSTGHMCYTLDNPKALQQVLGVSLGQAMEGVHELIQDRLRDESLSFQTGRDRHFTRAERIYSSFSLPHLTVSPEKVQRDTARRFEQFGLKQEVLKGKRLLDLGCHCGAMVLEAQRFGPAASLGIEFDAEKVELARAVARFNGLNQVRFEQGDVDLLEPATLGAPFDVVFCFAINKHVKKPERLYELLGQVTGDWLFFEGNVGTDIEDAGQRLKAAGFSSVTSLGMSDDDCVAKNNNRPLVVARRRSPS